MASPTSFVPVFQEVSGRLVDVILTLILLVFIKCRVSQRLSMSIAI